MLVTRCHPCGKETFSLPEAKRIARRRRRNNGERVGEYRCPFGIGWHVGHSKPHRRTR